MSSPAPAKVVEIRPPIVASMFGKGVFLDGHESAAKIFRPATWDAIQSYCQSGPFSSAAKNEVVAATLAIALSLGTEASLLASVEGVQRATTLHARKAAELRGIFVPTLQFKGGHRVVDPEQKAEQKEEQQQKKAQKRVRSEEKAAAASDQEDSSSPPPAKQARATRGSSRRSVSPSQ